MFDPAGERGGCDSVAPFEFPDKKQKGIIDTGAVLQYGRIGRFREYASVFMVVPVMLRDSQQARSIRSLSSNGGLVVKP